MLIIAQKVNKNPQVLAWFLVFMQSRVSESRVWHKWSFARLPQGDAGDTPTLSGFLCAGALRTKAMPTSPVSDISLSCWDCFLV